MGVLAYGGELSYLNINFTWDAVIIDTMEMM